MANMFTMPEEYAALPPLKLEDVKVRDYLIVSGALSREVNVDGECFTPWQNLQVEQDETGMFIPCCSGRYYFAERAGEDGALDGLKAWQSEWQKSQAAVVAAQNDPVILMQEIKDRLDRLALLQAPNG